MNELDRDQISMLKSTFDAFDVERKGYIETEMVGIIMDMLGAQVNAEELEGIINEIDEDENGEITFQEFLTLAAKFLVEEDEDTDAIQTELKGAFRMYDREGVLSLTARDIFSGGKCFDVVVYLVMTLEQLSCHQLFKTRRQVPQYGTISPEDHFTWFHKEGNGFITTQVLREILRELDDNLSENDLDNMIEEIDADGSGTVDWEEFRAVMIG